MKQGPVQWTPFESPNLWGSCTPKVIEDRSREVLSTLSRNSTKIPPLSSWLTMPTVQEVGDDGSAAGRPGVGTVNLDECWGHHVVGSEFPKHLLAHFHIVMGHVEHMACGVRQEDSEGRRMWALQFYKERGSAGEAREPESAILRLVIST